MSIIKFRRESIVQPDSAKRFTTARRNYSGTNEATFMHHVWPHLQKASREKQNGVRYLAMECDPFSDITGSRPDSSLPMPQQHRDKTYFEDDGLLVLIDEEFTGTLLPNNYPDQELEKAMRKHEGMTNPKPDLIYALDPQRFPLPQHIRVSIETRNLLEIVRHCHFPFSIVEGNAHAGNWLEAQNQARRGGATLVNAGRKLRERLDILSSQLGPDEETFVFSATISPDNVLFWVHWADVQSDRVVWNMTFLKGLVLLGANTLAKARRIVHNTTLL